MYVDIFLPKSWRNCTLELLGGPVCSALIQERSSWLEVKGISFLPDSCCIDTLVLGTEYDEEGT